MISDFISNSFKNIKRNKKHIFLIIIFSLLFILLFTDVIFFKNFHSYIDSAINNNISYRTFSANKEEINFEDSSKELNDLEHVSEVYKTYYNFYYARSDLNFNGLDGNIELDYGTENIVPKSIKGKSINELNQGEIICPYNFYPDTKAYDLKIDENKILKPDKIINYTFNVFYDVYKLTDDDLIIDRENVKKEFKIVGLYDNKVVMNKNNQCYVTLEDLKELSDSLNPSNNLYEDNFVMINIVVDETKNLDKVKKDVKNLGYYVSEDTIVSINTQIVNTISLLSITFFIIIIVAVLFLFISYINKKIKNDSKYIGTLRSCGFSKKNIIKSQTIENILILFISFIISSIIFYVLFSRIFKKIFRFISFVGYDIEFNLILIIILFLIIMTISISISIYLYKKGLKKQISELLNEEL